MSFYTIFDEQEVLLTSTTTTVIGSTDAVLVHSNVAGKKYQTTISALLAGPSSLQTLTSSTAVNINSFGITNCTVGITGTYILSAAPAPGYVKTITSSSSGTITITCSGASLSSTGALNGSTSTMNSGGAAVGCSSITLVSVGTTPSTRWIPIAYSSTTVLA